MKSIKQIIEQLEFCKFTDEHGHPLENNVAFMSLKTLENRTLLPEYAAGDIVYFMHKEKITKAKITSSQIFNCNSNQAKIQYTAEDFNNPVTWIDYQYLNPNQLFSSKTALIESL